MKVSVQVVVMAAFSAEQMDEEKVGSKVLKMVFQVVVKLVAGTAF